MIDANKTQLFDWLEQVDHQILQSAHSSVAYANDIAKTLLARKGKRLRAQLVLLISSAHKTIHPKAISLACIIELIHMATLMHDDVIDESNLRRGHISTRGSLGNAAAVLGGDFLYSQAFKLIGTLDHPTVLSHLASTTCHIVEGEINQLSMAQSMISENDYLAIITAKTGLLFSASAECARLLHGSNGPSLAEAGLNLGIGYQMIDDVLDYQVGNEQWGKEIGDDLRQGKCTLPLILLAKRHAFEPHELKNPSPKFIQSILQYIGQSDVLDQCRHIAIEYINKAQAVFGQLPQPDQVMTLCEKMKYRQF
ncbi:polyprenyl synthetase family protein [Gammaproteobacteria bacterium]|nr:polyprenyl synthetase family protein [Gammaproteobacteria bacterium]